jgi:hypothetical protein
VTSRTLPGTSRLCRGGAIDSSGQSIHPLINTFKVADAEAAVERFALATEIDPQFAAAYAQESRAVTHLLQLRDSDDPGAIARAAALNDKALALEPSLGEAWVQRA